MSKTIGEGSAWDAHLKGKCGNACFYCDEMPSVKKNTTGPKPITEIVDGKYATFTIRDTTPGDFQMELRCGPGPADQHSLAHRLAFEMSAWLEQHVAKKEFLPGQPVVGVIGVNEPLIPEPIELLTPKEDKDPKVNVIITPQMDA